ncbi:hypothetical protein [Roseixanthobacter glucoisosaccharinicivorans]|uniref:hypothetical protein n=1 Tax=Roseixanthobacter glucoisosaccharinicivorans TaxID=3119923 RepID=UPI003727BA42
MNTHYRHLLEQIENRPEFFEYVGAEDFKLKKFLDRNIRNQSQLTESDLFEIAKIKSARRPKLVYSNEKGAIEKITRFAFSEDNETTKLRILCALNGVGPGVASAVLAWTRPEQYGVIDVRAWRALHHFNMQGFESSKATIKIEDWDIYLRTIRIISNMAGRTPQEVDLWLYHFDSKEIGKISKAGRNKK